MPLKTIAEIAAGFARIDGISDEDHPAFDKTLRNLTQRHFLPPTEQVGRAFLYDPAAAVTIRLAQIAAEFGLPRTTIDHLTRWLSGSGERKKRLSENMLQAVSYAEEAVQRTEAGEAFGIHVILRRGSTPIVAADWQSDRDAALENASEDERKKAEKSRARVRSAMRAIGYDEKPEIARFTLPASALIAEILPFLKA